MWHPYTELASDSWLEYLKDSVYDSGKRISFKYFLDIDFCWSNDVIQNCQGDIVK